jgi:hypothetical protein
VVLIVWGFRILSPVELSERRLAVSGETSEKANFRHVWLSRFKNAKINGVSLSSLPSNLFIWISEEDLNFAVQILSVHGQILFACNSLTNVENGKIFCT